MNKQSELFEISKKLVPGGVHSPVRSFKGLPMTPRFMERADGAYIYDVENESYIDFCMSFGPLILGHRDPTVETELKMALERGWSYGACEPYSLKLAQFIVERIPFIEQIRFVNSGTEAVMTAIRLARGHTKKNLIVKFSGCYHGHTDSMLIKAGSGLTGIAQASSAGVPASVAKDTLILELNDLAALEDCFKTHQDIAAVIIEPLPANNGLLIQSQEFLQAIRRLTKEHQALLIFDEVISGFRIGFGGMSEKTKITPDIVTYGKIIGGGLPVGAVASTRKIMEELAPVGNVYQAGTLSANPLAMSAGLATLQKLTPETYHHINRYADKIYNIFRQWLTDYEEGRFKDIELITYESLFWFAPKKDIRSLKDIPGTLSKRFEEMFALLLEKGIYLAPNAYEVGFISLAHDEKVAEDLERRLWS